MGVDISAQSGVVVTATALADTVTEDNRERACRTLLRYAATILQSLRADSDDYSVSTAKLLLSTFSSLSIESTVKELQQMLLEMAPAKVDGFDSYVVNRDEAIEIWGELIEALFPTTPKPEGTVCGGSPRYQGWDLPQGEALFVFEENECFERVKTAAGKQLDSMLGETTCLTSWTVYSC